MQSFLAKQRIEGELGLVVIDYLQLLSVPGVDSRVQEVSQISRTLKQLSLELDCPVIALSQLNRAIESQNRQPMLSDLRESGSIEQDADVVMFLSREKEINPTQDEIICKVAKNRNGEIRAVKLSFSKAIGRFSPHVIPSLNDNKPF